MATRPLISWRPKEDVDATWSKKLNNSKKKAVQMVKDSLSSAKNETPQKFHPKEDGKRLRQRKLEAP